MWPHEDPATRVLHRPSTGAGLHLAAVAARAAQTYADVDPAYADRLLTAARRAYAAAHDHPALIAPDDQGAFGGGPYGDDDLSDDFFWAAAELGLAPAAPAGDPFPLDGFDFDAVAGPAHLSLGTTDAGADRRPTPAGPPAGPALGSAVCAGRAVGLGVERSDPEQPDAAGLGVRAHRRGRPAGRDPDRDRLPARPQRPRPELRHRLRHRLQPPPAHPALRPRPRPGLPAAAGRALAGGPTNQAYPGFPDDPRLPGLPPQQAYLDVPTSETTNDVCIRWNAPLVWVATFLTVTA